MFILTVAFWVSLFLTAYSYVIYPLLLMLIDRLSAPKTVYGENYHPPVTIIIAAYNEDKVIKSRIENCLSLDYPKDLLEIIIASDGSTDNTNDIIRPYKNKGINVYDFSQRRGKVNVLNEIVKKAKHPIILFSDANTMFARDAVKRIVRPFTDPRVGCVCGGLRFISAEGNKTGELEGFYWRYETFLKKMEGKRGALLGANGAIYAMRKELFEPCPSDTIIEDFVMPMKILQKGHKVIYEPEAMAIEETAKHIIHEKQRRVRIGAGDFQALFRLLPMLNPFKGFSALAFWSHKVLRWFVPFFLMVLFVSSYLLMTEEIYRVVFYLQCLFYLCAIIGQMLNWAGVNIKIFSLCYYFVSMNFALFLGFVRYVFGTQSVMWKRTER